MLVGILSDSHDRVEPVVLALNEFRARLVELTVHCGDVGGRRVLDLLAPCRAALVWGNTDWDRRELAAYAESLGIQVLPALGELEMDGKLIAVTHGDDDKTLQRVLLEQRHDYLLTGHTHVRADSRVGRVRLINPGALHRAVDKSVAVLDTTSDGLEFIRI